MSLRWKIALAMALIAATMAAAFGAASYRSTRDRLFGEIDRSLVAFDNAVNDRRLGRNPLPARGLLSGFDAQVIGRDGEIRETTFEVLLPVDQADLDLIDQRSSRIATVSTADGPYRVRTVGVPRGAVQIGRSLDETNRILASLRTRTILLAGLVSALAIAAGLWISGRVTASLRRLTEAAEHVESTGRLDVVVADHGDDEVGRLSVAFDRMLAALARSRVQQQRLVQDAGHELRTPLTSLRTNLDVLRRFPNMSDADRDAIIADLHAETEELTTLVNEVVSVASGAATDEPPETFDLVDVVMELADRYRRRTGRPVVVDGTATPVLAQRSGVQRAVSCLIENAVKFDSTGGPIEVTVRAGEVAVSDRGIGLPETDADMVFDRFHRAEAVRSMPGSGLGLSIVKDVAERHGGSVFASNRAGGGATVGFRLGQLAPPVA
jgi:two-component system, OmpR family, sensor histidine kinase MprB